MATHERKIKAKKSR